MSGQIARTHDTSFSDCHILDIEKLGADLNEAVQAAWPKRHSIRYSQVYVLLLSWEADDLEVHLEIDPLRRVLEDRYHFNVQDYKIPSLKPDKALKKRIYDFLDKEDEDTLLIVYYAGHARSAPQSNEASLWCANRDDSYLVVPSGGIQSMLEEADADVILLCDCCHSTAIPTTDSPQRKNNKVMEAITACGYEAIAAEVGDHSFTKALTHTLALASKGLPFTISELHARVVSKLKCYAPELQKGEDGNYVDTADNRLLFERQPRRTPIFTVVCRAHPARSIVIAPLGKVYFSPDSSEVPIQHQQNSSAGLPQVAMDIDDLGEGSSNKPSNKRPPKKRKRDLKENKYPFILISARLEKLYDKAAWIEWVRNAPDDVSDIHVEGAYQSFSTLLILRIPVAVWNLLPDNLAYSFIGYATSGNYAISQLRDCTAPASSSPVESTGTDTPQADSPQSVESDVPSVTEKGGETSSTTYTRNSTSLSYVAASNDQYEQKTSMVPKTTLSFHSLSLNNPPQRSPSALDESSSSSKSSPHAGIISRGSSRMSTASSWTQDLESPAAPPVEFYGHPRQSHSSYRSNRGMMYRYGIFWFCHKCGDGPMATSIPACTELTCNHWRCESCPQESIKIRTAA